MFTGLVEEVGILKDIRSKSLGYEMIIEASTILKDVKIGDSIATNGVCLTVVDFSDTWFSVDMLKVTAEVTQLHGLSPGSPLNLERALRPMDRMGGHILQGHIDTIGKIISRTDMYPFTQFEISIPSSFHKYIVEKGSVGINGISLTISRLTSLGFEISIIPQTLRHTNLKDTYPGQKVCIECDVIGKYIERLLKENEHSWRR
ncbi:MAG: riboflavin synthase [Tissierellia bacterium]|nr:riboflavin synthase [Tissierellia bacterium]